MTGVIFDVDGVLLDSMPVWMHAGEWYLERKGKKPDAELGKKLFSMSMSEGADYIRKHWKLQETEDEICEGINRLVMEYYQNEILPKTGVMETLSYLSEKKIPMVIATSTDEPVVRAAFRRLGMEHYFQKIFTCTAVGAGKSKPDIFYAAADFIQNDNSISELYVVEDSLYAAKTAKEIGFTVIGLYDEASSENWEELCRLADITSREMQPELFIACERKGEGEL